MSYVLIPSVVTVNVLTPAKSSLNLALDINAWSSSVKLLASSKCTNAILLFTDGLTGTQDVATNAIVDISSGLYGFLNASIKSLKFFSQFLASIQNSLALAAQMIISSEICQCSSIADFISLSQDAA
jgi:hypothetical protein